MSQDTGRVESAGEILIIGDTAATLQPLLAILTEGGYHVRSAGNGQLGLDAVADKAPDLILLEKCMPAMDGLDVCRHLKAQQDNRAIPVIFVSVVHDAVDKAECFRLGGVDYISKPFEALEVLARVKTHLAVRSMQALPETATRQLQASCDELERLTAACEDRIAASTAAQEDAAKALRRSEQAEATKRESESHLRSVFRAAPIGIGVVMDRMLKEANERMCEMTGYCKEELIGQNARMIYVNDEDYEYVGREKYEQIRDHGTGTVETQWKRKDGRIIDVLLSSTPMDLADLSKGVTFTALDITEGTRAEEALRRSEQRFRRIFEDGPIGMAVLDREYRFTRVNPALCGLLGYREQELIQKTLADVTDADYLEAGLQLAGQLFAGEIPEYTLEKRCIRQDGQLVWTSVTASAIHDDSGRAEHMLHIVEDISERKRAAETLEQLNRELLDRNNELASVLHATSQDLRDPLLSIQGFTRELARASNEVREILDDAALDDATRQRLAPVLEQDIGEAVPIILHAVTRVDILIDGLARMSRLSRESLEIGHLDMNAVLADVVGPLGIRARACGATLEVADAPPCLGDRPRISQVFAVLLDNALTYLDPARQGDIRVSGRVEGEQAVYCVEDSGVGIPHDRQSQCFDLFFSRSPSGSPVGTGLGLSIARRILDRHNGRIWVESEPGRGSRFYVSLPAVAS